MNTTRTRIRIKSALVLASSVLLMDHSAAATAPRLPVISKVQVLYSLVGHHNHLADRVSFYNTQASPLGNTNYVVPHLVYEPFVTLYNPYNTNLTLTTMRVQIANPPVGFRFKKNNDYLRTEFGSGQFLGLARFQIQNENNAAASKTFTLVLGGGTSAGFSGSITLAPGQARTFAVRLETNWTWAMETAGGFQPRGLYDWNTSSDFTNRDNRTSNVFGAECVASDLSPGQFRGGFQTDHLSSSSNRPAATKYSFEANYSYAPVSIKTTDTVSVEAKGVITKGSPNIPDFQLLHLRGLNATPSSDILKSYNFNIANLIPPNGAATIISRTFGAAQILQGPADTTTGGKQPFALFTIAAKSQALQKGLFQATVQPSVTQLYETRLDEVTVFGAVAAAGPSDALTSGIELTRMERIGDDMMLDIAARPDQLANFKVKGTANLAGGFHEDLTSTAVVVEGPANTGVYKVKVDVSGRGPKYFIRVEN